MIFTNALTKGGTYGNKSPRGKKFMNSSQANATSMTNIDKSFSNRIFDVNINSLKATTNLEKKVSSSIIRNNSSVTNLRANKKGNNTQTEQKQHSEIQNINSQKRKNRKTSPRSKFFDMITNRDKIKSNFVNKKYKYLYNIAKNKDFMQFGSKKKSCP